MMCPFREVVIEVTKKDINGDPLEFKENSFCTMLEGAPCEYCTKIEIFNRNTDSKVKFSRPDGSMEVFYGNY